MRLYASIKNEYVLVSLLIKQFPPLTLAKGVLSLLATLTPGLGKLNSPVYYHDAIHARGLGGLPADFGVFKHHTFLCP
jgi:hypothetical protein